MIALGIRWAVYVQQRQRLRAQIMAAQAGPLPAKEGVPVDAVAYVSKLNKFMILNKSKQAKQRITRDSPENIHY